jgi:cytochrome P450
MKLLKEIQEVLGEDGVPSVSFLKDLHYLQAFMDEVRRRSSVADTTLFHRCSKEVVDFSGFQITKHYLVLANIWAVHHDPKLWDDPMTFNPQRFLDAEGKFVKNDNLMTLGAGT